MAPAAGSGRPVRPLSGAKKGASVSAHSQSFDFKVDTLSHLLTSQLRICDEIHTDQILIEGEGTGVVRERVTLVANVQHVEVTRLDLVERVVAERIRKSHPR